MNRKTAWSRYLEEALTLRLAAASTSETVPNGSFESGDGAEPDGWHLVAGVFGGSTEWTASGGAGGGRCLRISPREGGASWTCEPIPINAGGEYLFRCAMKRDGNRHWAHACAVSWVSLVFLDASGRPCRADPQNDQPLVPVRCRKTAGWVEATRTLVAPSDGASLLIGFRIERGEPDVGDAHGFRRFWHGDLDTGDWWIDDVRLDRLPVEVRPPNGCLTIDVPEGVARLRVANEAGETFAPPGSIAYEHGGGCFHALRDRVRLLLPPGRYTVVAMRGFQRQVFRETVAITGGQAVSVRAELPRVVDLPARGLYAGDHHNHLSFHGATRYPMMTIDDVCRVARGEGLDYLSFCGEIVDQHAYADWRDADRPRDAKPDGAFETDDFICAVSHEVTQDLLGHTCLVNAPGHVAPGHPWWLAPTNAEVFETVRRGDPLGTIGAVALAHPYHQLNAENLFDVLADPSVTCLQRELPVDVALGVADTMDLLAVEPPADLALRFRDYYRLLNLGLRIGVSASSDVYADQGTEIIGALRTLVQADAFTMDAIAMGYRRRRTMATNGPLVLFSANGGGLGDTVAGPDVHLRADAYSNWGLTKVEVIGGGHVVADAGPGTDGWARIDTEVRLERSGWLIARAYGPGHDALNLEPVPADQRAKSGQMCVTSPIYVEIPGAPLLARREDAEYFIRWIDASCKAIRGRMALLQDQGPYGPVTSEESVRTALSLFARARKVYEQKL